MSDIETKQLNLTVPVAIHQKLDEIARSLSLTRTASLIMAVNEYHAKHVKPGIYEPPPKPN